MQGAINTVLVVVPFEFDFMGGSMGSVVGERFVRGVEPAPSSRICPLSASPPPAARACRKGLFSLMQMAKTTAALTKLSETACPSFSLLTDPTMGGVSASFAFVGDIVIAEPDAR